MSLREFADLKGRLWRVWDTYPEKPQLVREGYENGWLTFEADGDAERWRLVPFPSDWLSLEDAALVELLYLARHDGASDQAPAASEETGGVILT